MQPKMRQEKDADLTESKAGMTRVKTEQNQFPMKCGTCFEDYFVDNVTFENVTRAIKTGIDNPFECDDCQRDYDEAASETR